MWAKLIRLLRTASFRLAAAYAILFGASTLALFAAIYWIASEALLEQMRVSIETDSRTYVDIYRKGGREQFSAAIQQNGIEAGRRRYFLLVDPGGQRIAGNVDLPRRVEGWIEFSPASAAVASDPEAGEELRVLALGQRLPDGSYFLLGADLHRVTEAREAIGRAFGWGLGAMVLLAVGGGAVLSVAILRRIEDITRTSRAIVDGRLSQRIPVRGTNDELDRLASNLNDMLDRIEALMESLQQVSNDIAHDLRTPLTRLRQRLETARAGARCVADYDLAVDRALADTDAILSTFSAVLRIAQIESGSRRVAFADVSLSEVCRAVVDVYAPVAEDAGQSLRAEIEPNVATRGDRELLLQMLANLVENAIRHTPPGTTIAVNLAQDAIGTRLSVIDSGPGIPPLEREKVFRRYYRLESSRSAAGSGLGLALVAAVAELHRLRVRLEDNAPGLRVIVHFPSSGPQGEPSAS